MSFINVNVHFVWGTKNRAPILDSRETRRKIWEHIRENAHKKNIYIDTINGYCDHCHCLVSIRFDQTIGQVMMLIKGESSFWINKNKLCRGKFEWQDEYYAVAVSPSDLDAVRKYIRDQEDHHKYTSFQKELDEFIVACGFQKLKDGSMKSTDGNEKAIQLPTSPGLKPGDVGSAFQSST